MKVEPRKLVKKGKQMYDLLGNIINPTAKRHLRHELGLSPRQFRKWQREQRRLAKQPK